MAQTSGSNWIDSFLGCLSRGDLEFECHAINQLLICLELIQRRSCFGFYKSACAPIIDGEEHYNSSKIDDRASQKPLLYDSFLSSSTYDLEHNYFNPNNSSLHSLEKSISSANHQAEGSGVESHEFRNHGLLHWNEARQQWLGHRRQRRKSQEINNPRISWNATYENLLGTNRRFHQPIPLSEMIDFLVDVWEQEGLYENTTFGIL